MSTLPLFDHSPLFAGTSSALRPYQSRAIKILRDRVHEGKRRILLVAPTGAGKMVIISNIIRTASVPVIFVCHRMELIDQCVEQLAKLGITNVGVIRADDDRTAPGAATQVASIQTLARRKKPPAGLVLIDEAHRSASDSYQDLIFEYYKAAIIIGFTATPTRHDGRPLGTIFECLEVVSTYQELIKDGFIIAPECYGTSRSPDLSSVRTISGDYDEGALGELMRDQSLVGDLLSHWLELAHRYPRLDGMRGLVDGPRRRTFIFASGIQHSLDICARFEKGGVRIAHLDGKTPETDRRSILKALGNGDIDAVSNCNVLLEGVDIPSAKCVVHARPTQSLVLWRQSSGRILRPWHPGCPRGCIKHPSVVPLLLDHAGNIGRHGFPHEDLHWMLHEKSRRTEKKVSEKVCKTCFAYVPVARTICPHCGTEFPPTQKVDSPKETGEKLIRRSNTPEDMQRDFYDAMVKIARKNGYKTGFASFKFKDHYGAWPPWAWSEATRASFASDLEWQIRHESKLLRKKDVEKSDISSASAGPIEVDLNDALKNSPTEGEPPIEESESPFADWVDSL